MIPVTQKTPFVPGPVACASAVALDDSVSGQPIISEGILDWFRRLAIGVVTETPQGSAIAALDGVAKETIREVLTSGVVLPGDGEKLSIKAEGERSWQSCVLFVTPDFNVETDSVLRVKGVRYRITEKKDYSVNGYVRYKLTEDYERGS